MASNRKTYVIDPFAAVIFGGLAAIAAAIFGLVLVAAAWIVLPYLAKPSLAHGPAEWIQRDQYKNAAGELCCGERDCAELSDADVRVTDAGYFIVSIKETIPFADATPSPDGRFWRCAWGGRRKCFFAPPGAA